MILLDKLNHSWKTQFDNLNILFLFIFTIFFTACSGGDGGFSSTGDSSSDSSSSSSSRTGSATVYVNKGPITGAVCNLFNAENNKLAGPVSSTNGVATFSNFQLPDSNNIVFAECTGGTYTDESTGNTKTAPTLRAAKRTDSTTSVTLVNTPLTELAFRKSEDSTSDLSDYFQQSDVIAESMGIGNVDINDIRPTDVNTNQVADDNAGKYGTALASISQLKDDQFSGSTFTSMLNSMESEIGSSGLSSQYNGYMREAIINMNNEANVRNNLMGSINDEQYENLISTTQNTAYVLPTRTNISPSSPVVLGTNVTISGEGSNLDQVTAALSNGGSCGTVTVTDNNTDFTVDCITPTSGTTTKFTLTKNSAEVEGSAKTYTLTNYSSDSNAAAQLTSVAPTTVNYASTNTFTFAGNHLPTSGATATLGGRSCSSTGTASSTSLSFSCQATNTRTTTQEDIELSLPNEEYPLERTVTYSTPTVVISSTDPASISQSQAAPSNWKVMGSGLYTGLTFTFNGTSCTTNGTANDNGTEITGLDCSSINAPSSGTSADLVASGSNLPSSGNALTKAVTLSTLPVATLSWEGTNTASSVTERVGGRTVIRRATVTQPSSCSSASVSYNLETNPTSGVATISVDSNNQFTVTTGDTAGTATVTASSTAISGSCRAGELELTITVTALPVVSVSMISTDHTVTLGAATTYSRTATATPTSATITYSVDSSTPTGVATVDSSSGIVTISNAGTVTIKASATDSGYAEGSATYNLIVNKDDVNFSSPTQTLTIGTDTNNAITLSAANGQTTPAPTGSIQYSITNGTGQATISSTGLIHPTQAGTITQNVTYPGDDNYNSKTENYAITIDRAASSNVVMSWTTPPAAGTYPGTQTVAASASATGGGPTPQTGNIDYSTSDSSIASISSAGLITYHKAGSVNIIATFNGDTNYNSGSNISTNLTISKATPTVSFSGTLPTTLAKNDTQNITVNVTKVTNGSDPTGNVTISIAPTVTGVTLTSCTNIAISAGQATGCSINVGSTIASTAQNIVLTATYNGDDRYDSATQTHSFTEISHLLTSTLAWYDGATATSNFSVTNGGSNTLTLRVTGSTDFPNGTVTFTTTGGTGSVSLCQTAAVARTRTGAAGTFYSEWDCNITGTGVGSATINAEFDASDNAYADKTASSLTVAIN